MELKRKGYHPFLGRFDIEAAVEDCITASPCDGTIEQLQADARATQRFLGELIVLLHNKGILNSEDLLDTILRNYEEAE